ncbi:hypothetical protein HMPREF0765_3554 [Sphingobacterium spiritivorum ATCC 33300]|uniref:Uncharacterized protein n=1 Tax=Sphingobacterium spiritivorum ATCC 33300 TaxID=525372 RepID=C2G1U8_SPHSI|nr:hypothetical protein [Sphingobacterium spiritivorum]EEI91007.1 hypothetical protein HMPREF0765_3554 [Sphingobacterium spiritivorum ATCC 33300]QQS97880.1 hypothetical protein I6J03_09305 [Sphingobacterium spiritivorum]
MSEQQKLAKGYNMEELLRNYFLKSGYFVVRGVQFIYEGFEVTDIDLWLYSKTSSLNREIVIVDSKNKKTPQAIERIFWIQGLKNAVKASNAVIATTDRRPEVKNFGKKMNVTVLDGNFLSRITKSEDSFSARLTDEEFISLFVSYDLGKLDGDWKSQITQAKNLLSSGLSFDNCNRLLNIGHFFANQSIIRENQRQLALRSLYLTLSFFIISIDYTIREISFQDQQDRTKLLKEGFTFGSNGEKGFSNMLKISLGLIENNIKEGKAISRQISYNIKKQFDELNTDILAEYLSRNDVSNSLFSTAKEFENMAMSKNFKHHNSASLEARSMLFCLLDFWKIQRSYFTK